MCIQMLYFQCLDLDLYNLCVEAVTLVLVLQEKCRTQKKEPGLWKCCSSSVPLDCSCNIICVIKSSLTIIITQTSPFWSYIRCRGDVAQPAQRGAQPAGEKSIETH